MAPPASSALPTALSGATDLTGLAAFGKVAFALLVIIAVILAFTWLARRLGPGRGAAGQHLKIVDAKAVGTKERVVIVEVQGTWLVLGVAGGGVSKLHEMPAGKPSPSPITQADGSFAKRFAAALKQNLRGAP
ncbi:MAG: flagellar biosynthetic protein FliO [Rhodanobacteraceae bacterium]